GVDLLHDRLARQPGAVRTGSHATVHLCGDHNLFAAREFGERAADDLLRGAVGIDVGGIEEVDAGLDGLADDRPAVFLAERPFVVATVWYAEGHAPQAD